MSAIARFLLLAFLTISLGYSLWVTIRDLLHKDWDKLQEHALAGIAIFAGLVAVFFELRLHEGFKEQRKDIIQIVSEISTRYLGDWPGDLAHITEVIAKAHTGNELWLLVDHIGYGSFSLPKEFSTYFEILQNAARKTKVQILTYSEKDARLSLDRQFSKHYKGDLAELTASDKFAAFQKKYKIQTPSSFEEYKTSFLAVENGFCKAITQAGDTGTGSVAVRTLKHAGHHEEVFYWILLENGEPYEMIFAYPRFSGSETGHAFKTHDPQLIRTFQKQFERKLTVEESDAIDVRLHPGAG